MEEMMTAAGSDRDEDVDRTARPLAASKKAAARGAKSAGEAAKRGGKKAAVKGLKGAGRAAKKGAVGAGKALRYGRDTVTQEKAFAELELALEDVTAVLAAQHARITALEERTAGLEKAAQRRGTLSE